MFLEINNCNDKFYIFDYNIFIVIFKKNVWKWERYFENFIFFFFN